ncbi:MAG: hypothetical protein JSW71_10235 [Gemmatimonadota bacterium]|nr:MAG: hypothetical protein JSW71_10235 [Gemmatimonadota bacterium]
MATTTWVNWGASGAMAAPHLSQKIYEDALPSMKFDQFAEVPTDFGPGKGDEYFYRIEQDLVGAPTTFAGVVLNELVNIPLDQWTHLRGSVDVYEVGRGSSYTKRAQILSAWDVDDRTRDKLKRHLQRILDDGAATAFTATDIKYTPTAAAAGTFVQTGVALVDAAHQLTAYHIREMVDYLQNTLRAEPYDDDGFYVMITTGAGGRAIYDDLEIERGYLEAMPKERVLYGERGRYYRCRIIETNNTTLGTVGTANAAESVMFGKNAVLKPVVAQPIILAEERDKGRFHDIAWWGLLGYGCTLDYSTHGMASIIHVDSV